MFGKRCTLCGGKLDSHGVCKECGLDNNKNDKNYRVNQSSCDNQPLTHVHEEKHRTEPVRRPQPARPVQQTPAPGPAPGARQPQKVTRRTRAERVRRKRGCMIVIIVIVLGIALLNTLGEVIPGIFDRLENGDENLSGSYLNEEDPYANVTREIPAEGEEAQYELDSGTYIVGVHIPEGLYQAETADDFDVVSVHDYDGDIYLYEYKGKEGGNYLDDLRLYQGAEVEIDTESPVTLSTDNAQTNTMKGEDNPLTEEVIVTGEQTAGTDFEPGVYDFEITQGTGEIRVQIMYPDGEYQGEIYREVSLYLGEDTSTGKIYRNFVLPEKAVIYCEDSGIEILLTPSERIQSQDYFSFYESYY